MLSVCRQFTSGTSPLYLGHTAFSGRGLENDQVVKFSHHAPSCGQGPSEILQSFKSFKKRPRKPPRAFRAAAASDGSGASENERASSTVDLLEALKGAERALSGQAQGQDLQPHPDISNDDIDKLVGTDPGTTSLLEALHAIEHTRPSNGRNRSDSENLRLPAVHMNGPSSNSQSRVLIQVGSEVDIVLKKDQVNGRLTRGLVAKVLTNSQDHPRGIKVRLKTGEVGRVHDIIATPSSAVAAPAGAAVPSGVAEERTYNEGGEDIREEGFSGRTERESRTPRRGTPQRDSKVEQGTKIFVSGLPREATNEDLAEALRAVDGVVDAFLVMNKQKRCQGYGFVQLVGDVDAALAKMNGLEVRGQKLTAAVSVERKPSSSGETNVAEGTVRQNGKREGERGFQRTRQAERDGASLLLEAFRGVQEKRKARPGGGRKGRRGGGGPKSWTEQEDEDDVSGGDVAADSEEIDGQDAAETGDGSGEPRVITIKDETAKQADAGQPSMGQLVMAALERARKEKGIESGPAASAAEKGVAQSSGEAPSDDEQEHVPLKPLSIDPQWTETIEALGRRLEEVKSLPVES